MSRRKTTRRAGGNPAPRRATDPQAPCPCGLTAGYGECCGRFHAGEAAAPTAERLMRSRYAAFAVRDTAYLLGTWHPDTRPRELDLAEGPRWTGLDILATTGGSAFHTEGTVTFRAHFTAPGGTPDSQYEHSRFTRHDGAWVYVEAV
ncbi:YchJ family protein [Streptomyces iconiensis]|uniref:UPF0225 protein NMN56_003485 n=1 Tax=Streptomyces iconiensis TaxID=1384038 RepID=A0ABT6ZPP3_9ACTN|nr:YchJ family metal-binding protein [Streptomyces iconiensis]MDJ1131029.1 YchJ family metal-binding protein [Streptomyces iconiensis]